MQTARSPLLASVICVSAVLSIGQVQSGPNRAGDANGSQQAAATAKAEPGSWFKAMKAADGVWCIDDHGGDNMYLVEGKEKALLIDTGLGVAKLSDSVKTLTRFA